MTTLQTPWYRVGSSFGLSAAEAYERYLAPAIFAPWAQDLVELAAPVIGQRVLDVACGTGVIARAVGPHVDAAGKVVGLDLNAGMLDVARSLPWTALAPVEWCQADALDLPFEDESFDLVLCQQGLQFFPDRLLALRQMRRVLTWDGRLAVSVWRPICCSPGFESLHNALTRHIGPAAGILEPFALGDPEELRNILGGAGFPNISIRQAAKILEFPSPHEFVWRYVTATPLARMFADIDEHVRAAIVDDVANDVKTYASTGRLAFPIESHLLLAYPVHSPGLPAQRWAKIVHRQLGS
jgi:ubiquinone/menaquinone biosynthesis C-methylase UbiE